MLYIADTGNPTYKTKETANRPLLSHSFGTANEKA
tara:strand:+ start:188 stop:292 length:105 start_codon:yes stop_codon:yes gene_type:complete